MNTELISSDLILNSEFESWWDLPKVDNVADYILKRADEHAKAGLTHCLKNIGTGETLFYNEVNEISRKIASKLSKLGFGKGDTVIYSTHDPAKVHVFMLGVWRANGIVRSCYPEEIGDALVRRIKESKATFLACDDLFARECLLAANSITKWSVKVIKFGGSPSASKECLSILDFYNDDGSSLPSNLLALDDVALVLPTSGTTGDSKGAVYTHRILLMNILAHENMPYTDRDQEPTLVTSRQTHYVGSVTVLSFITRGRFLLMMPNVTVERLLEAVEKYKVRAIVAFPTYVTGMMNHAQVEKYDLSSLSFLTTAGQVVVPESMAVIRKLGSLKTFINLYGMTEAGLLVTSADWSAMKIGKATDLACKDYSVGKLPPDTSLKVLDIDSGDNLGAKQNGELCFKTPITTAGYLSRPKEASQTFLNGGWIKTGDIGYYDNDGFVYVVDRAKEVFKWNSNHVCPSEIENVLLQHASVAQAAVLGVPGKNDEGFVARAFVVLKEGKRATQEELINFAQNNLPPYKHLYGGLFIIEEMPVGKTGKIIKKVLQQLELPFKNE